MTTSSSRRSASTSKTPSVCLTPPGSHASSRKSARESSFAHSRRCSTSCPSASSSTSGSSILRDARFWLCIKGSSTLSSSLVCRKSTACCPLTNSARLVGTGRSLRVDRPAKTDKGDLQHSDDLLRQNKDASLDSDAFKEYPSMRMWKHEPCGARMCMFPKFLIPFLRAAEADSDPILQSWATFTSLGSHSSSPAKSSRSLRNALLRQRGAPIAAKQSPPIPCSPRLVSGVTSPRMSHSCLRSRGLDALIVSSRYPNVSHCQIVYPVMFTSHLFLAAFPRQLPQLVVPLELPVV